MSTGFLLSSRDSAIRMRRIVSRKDAKTQRRWLQRSALRVFASLRDSNIGVSNEKTGLRRLGTT